jgi:hypothetical protein
MVQVSSRSPKMLKQKTHFEQVPLAVVEKILKAAGAEAAIEPTRAIADQKPASQASVAGTLGARRKNLSLVRGKQVRYQAH